MTTEQWAKLHKQPRFQPKYPSEIVVQWAKTELPDGAHVLDHGCGAGRHTNFLKAEGFSVYRYDTSPGVEAARTLPAEQIFDAVLSYGVLCYMTPEQVSEEIVALKRCTKPSAKGLFVVRSTASNRKNRGDSDIPQYLWAYEDCVDFGDQFTSYTVDYQHVTFENSSEVEADWIIRVIF